jgi:hypothetical protein
MNPDVEPVPEGTLTSEMEEELSNGKGDEE